MIPDTVLIIDPPEGFQSQLNAVVERIPPMDWNNIFEYWSELRRNSLPFLNRITFTDDPMPEGRTFPRGRKIEFRRSVWRDKEGDYIIDLIAHELAHVYDWCAGPAKEIEGNGAFELPETVLRMERRAIETTMRWGFKIPGTGSAKDHYKKYADLMLRMLPPDLFPHSHPSIVYLRAVAESGDVPLSE